MKVTEQQLSALHRLARDQWNSWDAADTLLDLVRQSEGVRARGESLMSKELPLIESLQRLREQLRK